MQKRLRRAVLIKVLIVSISVSAPLLYGLLHIKPISAAVSHWETGFDSDGALWQQGIAGGSGPDLGYGIVVQDDGKVLIVGSSNNASGNDDMVLWKFAGDGSLDTTFAGVGYVTDHDAAGGNGSDIGYAVAVQSDGKIVVAGQSESSGYFLDLVVWRYDSNGNLDASFDGDGIATHRSAAGGNFHDRGYDLAIQDDGKIVVAGVSYNSGLKPCLVVWRFNSDGSLDSQFDGGGYLVHKINDDSDEGSGVSIQADNKIVVTGLTNSSTRFSDLAVWRFISDGSLDASFGGTGYVTHDVSGGDVPDEGESIVIQNDERIVVAGRSESQMVVWRFDNDGTLDSEFNGCGYLVCSGAAGGSYDRANSVALDENGKIVVAGTSGDVSWNEYPAIWRVKTGGTLDSTFNGTGSVYFDGYSEEGYNVGKAEGIAIGEAGLVFATGVSETAAGNGNNSMIAINYFSAYQISNLSLSLDVEDVSENNIENGTNNGLVGNNTVVLKNSSGYLLSNVSTDFTDDLGWVEVTGAVDLPGKKSVVANLTSAAGTASTHSLYVPKGASDDAVGICPSATTLAQIGADCAGLVVKQETDSDVSIVTDGGQTYWKVDGLSGTGGFSALYIDLFPEDDDPEEDDQDELDETGDSAFMLSLFGVVVTISGALLINPKQAWKRKQRF